MKKKGRKAGKSKKAQPDLLYELGKRSVELSKGLAADEPKTSFNPEDIEIDFDKELFKEILKDAIFDKETTEIVLRIRPAKETALEKHIKSHFANFQAEFEQSASMDSLTWLAERVQNSKIAVTDKATELFYREKNKLLKQIEEKFNGKTKISKD